MAYDMDSLRDGCYENSTVLINKFDIHDPQKLDKLEQTITAINAAEIELTAEFNHVNFAYYKQLHKHMFCELYTWAGETRTVNMQKKGTRFCDYREIEKQGNRIFQGLQNADYLTHMDFPAFIQEFTNLYCQLNMLHPFREGNGRVQRLFLTLLIRNAGYDISFSDIDPDLLMIATIKSVSGDIFLLQDIFKESIQGAD